MVVVVVVGSSGGGWKARDVSWLGGDFPKRVIEFVDTSPECVSVRRYGYAPNPQPSTTTNHSSRRFIAETRDESSELCHMS